MSVEPALLDTDAIISRMRQVVAAKNDAGLAAALKLTGSAPSNWRQRNAPPFAICAQMAVNYGVSLDWLIFGIGRMARSAGAAIAADTAAAEGKSPLSPPASRVTQFVKAFDASRPLEEVIWLEQHLKRTVSEYADWLPSSGT